MGTDIQNRLRGMRRRLNISQRELGGACGITAAAISGYELGREPNAARTKQIVGALYRLAHEIPPRRDLPIY